MPDVHDIATAYVYDSLRYRWTPAQGIRLISPAPGPEPDTSSLLLSFLLPSSFHHALHTIPANLASLE